MTDDRKKPTKKPSRRVLPKDIPYPDASHPIFSNPTVIGSRANLMRSMPKAVDASEETEEDGPLDEPDKKSTRQPSRRALPKDMTYPDSSDPIFSNPTVIGSRANLMRSMPKVVDTSEETEASTSTPPSDPSMESDSDEKDDGSRAEHGPEGTV